MQKKRYRILPFIIQSTLWWVIMRPLTRIFAHLEIEGESHISDIQGPVIFAPNHSSAFDPVLLPLTLPFWGQFSPIFFVSKQGKYYSSWKKFVFNFFNLAYIGAIPLDAEKKDYATALKRHVEVLKDGNSVCIFPEGRLTKDGLIRPGHGGVSYLANTTGRPVVPVLIDGTFKISPLKFFLRRQKIRVTFFPPVYFEPIEYAKDIEVATAYRKNAEKILNVLREKKGEDIIEV
ncbi:MAG: lysophospholipid acyltransferase family protein [Patescibacteria group bacterium UBA2163]